MSQLSNQPSPGRLLALIMIGCGFLALGVAFMLKPEDAPFASSSQDFSTIPVEVDLPAPDLTLTTVDGSPASLADYQGKVVLVNLWATWCPPCREEMPALQAFYEEHRSNGFVLIAIDQGETEKEVVPFMEEYSLTFPVWLDPASMAGAAFNTMNLPSSYVIDRTGRIRLMWIGGISRRNLDAHVPGIIFEDS
ncbi:MAG: redoxin domain-containing protein [Anaerolineales bacterium]|jgi:peroxiredoxin|nr:redoxin domain-containing protein [Anaerolineales bacterium]